MITNVGLELQNWEFQSRRGSGNGEINWKWQRSTCSEVWRHFDDSKVQ